MDCDRTNVRGLASALVVVAAFVILAGCGDQRPETFPVQGKVTYRGKPVTSGRVIFYPENGRSAQSEILADGTFKLTTFERGDGAVVGKHQVTIKSTRVVEASAAPKSFDEELRRGPSGQTPGSSKPRVEWLVPEKFSRRSTTTLAAEVTSDDNQVDLRIP